MAHTGILEDAATLAVIVGSITSAIGVGVGILYQRRAYNAQEAKIRKQKAIEIERDLIVRREFLIPIPKADVLTKVRLLLGKDYFMTDDSTEQVGVFVLKFAEQMRKNNPKAYRKVAYESTFGLSAKGDKILTQNLFDFYRRLNPTVPSEVRVRVIGEERSEAPFSEARRSRCVAECHPHFYEKIHVPCSVESRGTSFCRHKLLGMNVVPCLRI